jgi:hypothetical protein
VEVVVQGKTNITQWAVMGKTSGCALKKLRQGKGLNGVKVVPDVDEIIHIVGSL